jgi:hypothetical protein|tara:strand:- start:211 stop:873 length:663 start_codon:yes stop_codon:yes gene_type:complete
MQINNKIIFGFPIMSTKINKNSYDKKNIVSTIETNFKINNKRNNWDKESLLHHSANDRNNLKYKKINFKSILPVYKETILSMLKKLNTICNYSFEFDISNYTCLSNNNFMKPHIHADCHFTAVHYLQFDKKNHKGTRFINTLPFTDYIKEIAPGLYNVLSLNDNKNSWLCESWIDNVEEDDFYFYPAYLKHTIDPQVAKNKNRITIVLNIKLLKEIKNVH